MSKKNSKKPVGKLDLNKETLRSLVDLSKVRGGEGQQVADNVVSRNGAAMAGSTSWILCCCGGAA
jgi:hypothetical protein